MSSACSSASTRPTKAAVPPHRQPPSTIGGILWGSSMRRGLWIFLTALAATVAATAGQTPQPPPAQPHNFFQSRIDLVGVTATVIDQDGGLVTGLSKDDFEIYEDGVRQPIAQF